MTTGPFLLDVSPALAGHIATAIRVHREWAAGAGLQLPEGLVEVESHLASRAMRGQRGTPVDDLWEVRDGQLVSPRLLSYEDTGRALSCSVRTVKRLVAAGDLPAVRLGEGSIRIRVSDVDAYVAGLSSTNPTGATAC
jgi:excisionase family DNA binding protein